MGRVAVITGGGSGIGRAIAAVFAREGARVVIVGRREARLREVAEDLGPAVGWQAADVSRREQVAEAVAAVVARFGRIDVLVNAAGFVRGITTDLPLDEAERIWDEELGTNLKGSFLMAVAAPHLPRPGGRIINISSIAAFTGGSRPGALGYAAAKAGLHGLTYGLARELSPQGITVNAIAPGFIGETGFTGTWPEDRVRGTVEQTPVGRAGTADDVAAAALYLASPAASFVTGEVLNVNGGWLFGH
ncbi:MAG: SDR family oxidoreductase [Chloroflexota bacterium]|nr:SDR family oxidoreductase [Chloroflexota bacterium]